MNTTYGETLTVKKDLLAQDLGRQIVGGCPVCDTGDTGLMHLLTAESAVTEAGTVTFGRVVGAIFDCGHWTVLG